MAYELVSVENTPTLIAALAYFQSEREASYSFEFSNCARTAMLGEVLLSYGAFGGEGKIRSKSEKCSGEEDVDVVGASGSSANFKWLGPLLVFPKCRQRGYLMYFNPRKDLRRASTPVLLFGGADLRCPRLASAEFPQIVVSATPEKSHRRGEVDHTGLGIIQSFDSQGPIFQTAS